ncbi:MAG: hypothetical protein KatS3mg013_1188 [Actinomycetota bacterium]|nr:MAG: hypothetical protein KatS3mg013_1188 [Actinomycetota bacterium]
MVEEGAELGHLSDARVMVRGTALLLLVCVSMSLPAGWASAAIRIAKIQYDPPGTDTGTNAHLNKEFVVITNTGGCAVRLDGWVLKDAAGHRYTFGPFRLRAGKSVTIHTGRGADDRNDLYWGPKYYIWNNDGDTATLKNAAGKTVDSCRYPGGGTAVTC